MGKTTRFHPLPLSVLRGALQFCEWKMKSLKFDPSGSEASSSLYRISKLVLPPDFGCPDVFEIKKALQKCFPEQVRVTGVTHNTNTGLQAWIRVYTPEMATRIKELVAEGKIREW